jgi:putative membrane protein
MLGSLLKVWPWKVPGAVEGFDYPALPGAFAQVTGMESQLGLSIAFAVLGLAIVLVIEFVASKGNK